MPRCTWLGVAALLLVAAAGPASSASPPVLAFPVACEIGKTCYIQKYVDRDPGKDVLDYACGSETDDGHDGIDFRVLSLEAASKGVAVLAAAPGTVKNFRDGVPDRFVTSAAESEAISKIGCGNAVVLDHGDGWITLYCHMKQGSIRVKTGDHVDTGTPLGLIGYSGLTEYTHVHFGVRHGKAIVDPFTGEVSPGVCFQDAAAATAKALWKPELLAKMPYQNSLLLEAGFAGDVVSPSSLEQGPSALTPATADSPALLFYARLINMLKGDQLRFAVTGPGGFEVSDTVEPLDRNKAQWVAYAGKKRKTAPWPAGKYEGKVEVLRAGQAVRTASGTIEIK